MRQSPRRCAYRSLDGLADVKVLGRASKLVDEDGGTGSPIDYRSSDRETDRIRENRARGLSINRCSVTSHYSCEQREVKEVEQTRVLAGPHYGRGDLY